MAKQTYQGSCHCKRVKFEVVLDINAGTSKCNCTNCWKKRMWTARANLDPAALAEAPVTFCDGRADNWWNPPAEIRHL